MYVHTEKSVGRSFTDLRIFLFVSTNTDHPSLVRHLVRYQGLHLHLALLYYQLIGPIPLEGPKRNRLEKRGPLVLKPGAYGTQLF